MKRYCIQYRNVYNDVNVTPWKEMRLDFPTKEEAIQALIDYLGVEPIPVGFGDSLEHPNDPGILEHPNDPGIQYRIVTEFEDRLGQLAPEEAMQNKFYADFYNQQFDDDIADLEKEDFYERQLDEEQEKKEKQEKQEEGFTPEDIELLKTAVIYLKGNLDEIEKAGIPCGLDFARLKDRLTALTQKLGG